MSDRITRTVRRTALLLALAAPALAAQQSKPPAAAHEHAAAPKLDAELAEHFKGIHLTDAQVAQVTAIKAKHHAEMDKIHQAAKSEDDPALKAALQKHMDAAHAEFKAMLTPEQYTAFEANMKARHAMEAKAGEKHDAMHDMGGMKHDAMMKDKAKAPPAPKKP
ncbi:MAG: hypothetical protein OEW77_02955 [Gemmatimonadota bacterium]|nr:hypothetical protein [Gemmatimonadota bacterium]